MLPHTGKSTLRLQHGWKAWPAFGLKVLWTPGMRIAYRSVGCRPCAVEPWLARMIPVSTPEQHESRRIAGRLIFVDASNRLIRVWDGSAACDVLVPPGCE